MWKVCPFDNSIDIKYPGNRLHSEPQHSSGCGLYATVLLGLAFGRRFILFGNNYPISALHKAGKGEIAEFY